MIARTKVEVGSELPALELEPISRATLALFAAASGDHNPIHIDLDVARSAGLDDVFAHGMLSMAYLGRLLTRWAPQQNVRSLRTRFVAITPVHGQPHCSGRITAVENGLATIELTVKLAEGTTTLIGEATVEVERLGRTSDGQA